MQAKERKIVYTLGATILAVVVFLLSLFFVGTEDDLIAGVESTSSSQSSSMQQQSSSGAGLGGGGGQSGGGGGDSTAGVGGGNSNVWFKITTDYSGRLYLRQDSKGEYTGTGEHGFVGDKKYYLENPTDINPLYYMGLSKENEESVASKTAQIELVKITNDLLPYGVIGKESAANTKEYSVTYYPYALSTWTVDSLWAFTKNNEDYIFMPAEYAEQEALYWEFVEENYLSISDSLKQTLLEIAEENGIYETSDFIVTDVASYVRNAAYYDFAYVSTDYPADKDMVTYFLTEHKRGVCRHFAAAATMMFRALGIPARYTIGFAVDVEENVTLEYEDEGHAWTEIYIRGYGWVPVEVTGGNIYQGGAV